MAICNIIVSVTFIKFLSACTCVCENMCMWGGVRGKTCGDLGSFTMGVSEENQVITLSRKCLKPLSHLCGQVLLFFKTLIQLVYQVGQVIHLQLRAKTKIKQSMLFLLISPVQLPPSGRASSKHSWYIWKGTKVSLEPWQRFYINVHPRLPCTNFWKQQDLWQGDSWPASEQAWPHKDCRTVPLVKQDPEPPPQLGPLRRKSHQE